MSTDDLATTTFMVALHNIAVPDDAPEHGLLLNSADIGYKFGFNDGDWPDAVNTMVESYYDTSTYIDRGTWGAVLLHLVTHRLLPALGGPPVDVWLMESLHNPIQVSDPLPADFPHNVITVPWHEVLALTIHHHETRTP